MVPLDQSQDIDGTRLRYLKTAAILPVGFTDDPASLCPPAEQVLNQSIYADDILRRLPCHTKEATLASAAYFYSAPTAAYGASGRAIIEPALKSWADYHQIADELQAVKRAATQFSEIPESAFITNTQIPARTDDEIRAGIKHLEKFASVYLVPDRKAIASELFARGKNLTVDEADFLQKHAGVGVTTMTTLQRVMERCAATCRLKQKSAAAGIFERYAEAAKLAAKTHQFADSEMVQKVACETDVIMREVTGKGVDTSTFIDVTPVAAAEYVYRHLKLANDCVVRLSDFSRCPTEKLASILGLEAAASITQQTPGGRQKLASLDPVTAGLVCEAAGVKPVERPRTWSLDLASLVNLSA